MIIFLHLTLMLCGWPVADGHAEGDEAAVGGQAPLQTATQQRGVDIPATDRQHNTGKQQTLVI